MKILHISTSDSGGAGIAAKRLHRSLLKASIDSKMLCLTVNDRNEPHVYEYPKHPALSLIKRALFRFKLYTPNWLKHQHLLNKLGGSFEIYTFPDSDYRIDQLPFVLEADIIHLHWVANFLDYKSFFSNINKPIVWTLHDMNPFLGGFHYMDDVLNNKQFKNEESRIKKLKLNAYSQAKSISIVTLSQYIKDISEKSELFGKFPHYLIPNGYTPILNSSISKNSCKAFFNIPENKKVILFVCDNIHNHRKGFDILNDALKAITIPSDYQCVAIGEMNNTIVADNITFLGFLGDQRLLEMAYRMADVFILPSREDNLPNTMLEALTQGVPVISFSKGGMKDIINEQNGILLKNCSVESLKEGLLEYFNNPEFNSNAIKNEALNAFSEQKRANQYIDLYNMILSSN